MNNPIPTPHPNPNPKANETQHLKEYVRSQMQKFWSLEDSMKKTVDGMRTWATQEMQKRHEFEDFQIGKRMAIESRLDNLVRRVDELEKQLKESKLPITPTVEDQGNGNQDG